MKENINIQKNEKKLRKEFFKNFSKTLSDVKYEKSGLKDMFFKYIDNNPRYFIDKEQKETYFRGLTETGVLKDFVYENNKNDYFETEYKYYKYNYEDDDEYDEDELEQISKAEEKNYYLCCDLENARNSFCGIGTKKIKCRLNKLAKVNNIAKYVRMLLEVEDINIQAKKYYGKFKDKNYERKEEELIKLLNYALDNDFKCGVNSCNDYKTSKIAYFELPNEEQISFHCNVYGDYPKYEKEWDGKINSTLQKLEQYIKDNFCEILK